VSELVGLLLIALGMCALVATGALGACCLHLRSPVAFLLAAYLLAWTWLVALTLALSPARWVTRGSLLAALVIGAALALAGWAATGSPRPPDLRRALRRARDAGRDPAILVLGAAVALGVTYIGALALFTPPNDLDVYHVARASLWHQGHGVRHIAAVGDARVNLFPPDAEIGQLATMVLASSDRYVALPQLLAYVVLAVSVAGLGRKIGLGDREAVFAALAFATLPVVAIEAPSAMNDLVVASFLVCGVYFGLCMDRASLLLLGLAVALAVGTKYTAIIALPTLALAVAVGQPRRRWPALLASGLAGCLAGSVWYALNFLDTGGIGTNVPNQPEQSADVSPVPVTVTAIRLAISFVDMSGAPWPYSAVFFVAAGVLGLAGLIRLKRSRAAARSLLAAAGVTAAVVAMPLVWELIVRGPFKLALLLGRSDVLGRFGWAFNTTAEPLTAWYGPLGLLLLIVGSGAAIVLVLRRRLPGIAAIFALAPLVLVGTLALVLSYDATRGRLLVFGIALGAATWGVILRSRSIAFATAAIGATSLLLALANYNGKSSGLLAESSIWGMARWQAQTARNPVRYAGVVAYVEETVPEDAHVALSVVGEDLIHPFFGPRLTRHVDLVPPDRGSPPEDADWLVLAPEAVVRRCSGSWRPEYVDAQGWRVERRLAADDCFVRGQ
jgi:4-amino-4-deoxy-L-arabinose transferase-like glycosyltransferase